MQALTKSQLARAAGVSVKTLRRWLDDPYMREQLAPFNLSHRCKILPPGAVQIICDHYVITFD